MHRLRFLRLPLGSAGGIRPRTAATAPARSLLTSTSESTSTADRRDGLASSSPSSSRYLSTSTNKKYEDIPRRIYQSAPKRSHGKHAGKKKATAVKGRAAEASPSPPAAVSEDDGDMQLALGKAEGSRNAADALREVSTGLKEIRVSPWSLNLLAKLVRGLPVAEASAQLQFCKKKHTTTVEKAIQNALNLADMRYGLAAEELEVGEIFVTKGKVQKRIRIMGRGRAGIARRKWSHLNVTLREIDFDEKIKAAPSRHQREKLEARKEEVDQLRAERGEPVFAEAV